MSTIATLRHLYSLRGSPLWAGAACTFPSIYWTIVVEFQYYFLLPVAGDGLAEVSGIPAAALPSIQQREANRFSGAADGCRDQTNGTGDRVSSSFHSPDSWLSEWALEDQRGHSLQFAAEAGNALHIWRWSTV
jgi:hypothetical protein